MQEAVIAVAPTADACAVKMLPKTLWMSPTVPLEADIEMGFEELQVRGTLVIVIPKVSVTVAFRVVEMLVFTTIGDAAPVAAAIEIA